MTTQAQHDHESRKRDAQRIGAALARHLEPIATKAQVAHELHMSEAMVRYYERSALFKVAARMLYL